MMSNLHLERRLRHLPTAIENTERKLAALYREAKRYRMDDVLRKPSIVNSAWDREVLLAQIEAAERGEEYSMGFDGI